MSNQIANTAVIAPPHPLKEFWQYFSQNKGAVVGLVFIVVVAALALLAPLIAPHPPFEQYRDAILVPPMWQDGGSARFILGTDDLGRDIVSRLMYGARLSLFIGVVVVTLS